MSILTWAIQAEDSPAHVARLLGSVLLNEGVVGVADDSFEVLEDTGSNLNVRVGSGTVGDLAVVQGDSSADQGVYVVESQDATDTVTLSAGDGSNDRIDLIVIRVQDDEADSGGQNESILDVVEGTPASSPSAPSLPDNCLLLAEVEVGQGASAVTDADITDMRSESALREEVVASDYVLLGEATADGSSVDLTVANIPQTHRDLKVVVKGGHDGGATFNVVGFRINGDGGNNYNTAGRRIDAAGTLASVNAAATSRLSLGSVLGNGLNSSIVAEIPAYSDTQHTVLMWQVFGRIGSATTAQMSGWGSGNHAVSQAVTSVTALGTTDEWTSGSTLRVYGIGRL